MTIVKPFKNAKPTDITQGFSDSHQANDFASTYGTFLCAPFNAKVLNIVTASNIETTGEELRRGFGIRIQSIEDPTISMTFWHCLPFFACEIGDTVLQGQPIGQMGNSGFVLSGGVYVEVDIRSLPPYPGTHTHISMGQNIGGVYSPWDYSKVISWDIPINYSVIDTVSFLLKKLASFLNKGR